MPNKTLVKWEEKTINDVCMVERGSSPRPIKDFITTDNNGVNWIKIGDCSGKYVTNTAQKITQEGAKKSRYVKVGDFIISNSMSYGKPYILKIDGYIHDGWFVLRLNNDLVNTDYFYYLLSSNYIREQYDALATGAIVQNISSDLIKKVTFKLPPLQEQQRIVGILDEAFENIEKAKQNALQNLNNTKELFEKNLIDIIDKLICPYDEIKNYTKISSGGTPLKSHKEYWINGDIPWYSSGELNLVYTEAPEKYITKLGLDNSNAKVFPKNSLLIGMYDTAAFKMSILDRDACFNQAICAIAPCEKLFNPFLYYFFKANRKSYLKDRVGIRQQNLNKGYIENLKIPILSIAEQQKVVAKLDELQEHTKKLEQIYEQKIKDLDELKQSILQKAFNGEL